MHPLGEAISTETYLLPGQQFCIGLPWERAALPRHGLPRAPTAPPKGNVLDAAALLDADVIAGAQIGACQVIRRLSPGSVQLLLAVREDELGVTAPVILRRLELPEALAREVQAHAEWASKLRHPNLARVYPCETSDEGIFWVTELSAGANLLEVAEACRKAGKAVPVGLALAAIHGAALAMAELHTAPGHPHGLVCAQSVTVDFDGTPRLQDAGLFRTLARQALWPEVLERIGPYLAPEQVLHGQMPSARTDVFALAAVLHEFLAGTPAQRPRSFDEQVKLHRRGAFAPPSSLNIALGPAVDEVVLKALAPDPAHRYPTAVDFACALRRATAELFWRPALIGQFVAALFPERKRREEVLLAEPRQAPLDPLPARPAKVRLAPAATPPRPPPLPRRRLAARQTPLLSPAMRSAARVDTPLFSDVILLSEDDLDDAPPSHLRVLGLLLVAVSLAWFAQSGLRLDELDRTAPALAARAKAWTLQAVGSGTSKAPVRRAASRPSAPALAAGTAPAPVAATAAPDAPAAAAATPLILPVGVAVPFVPPLVHFTVPARLDAEDDLAPLVPLRPASEPGAVGAEAADGAVKAASPTERPAPKVKKVKSRAKGARASRRG